MGRWLGRLVTGRAGAGAAVGCGGRGLRGGALPAVPQPPTGPLAPNCPPARPAVPHPTTGPPPRAVRAGGGAEGMEERGAVEVPRLDGGGGATWTCPGRALEWGVAAIRRRG